MEESLLMARNKERTSNARMKLWDSDGRHLSFLPTGLKFLFVFSQWYLFKS